MRVNSDSEHRAMCDSLQLVDVNEIDAAAHVIVVVAIRITTTTTTTTITTSRL